MKKSILFVEVKLIENGQIWELISIFIYKANCLDTPVCLCFVTPVVNKLLTCFALRQQAYNSWI